METRANHIWVGAVTLLLLAGIAALTVWIARLNQGEQDHYDIFFKQSVDGLAKGSEVSFSGVPSGQVEDIDLWEKDPEFVRVRIKINRKVPILQGTTASLQGSFTGVTTIQLQGAVKGAPPIEEKGPEGVPVIPTKRGGLGEILANTPLLLERHHHQLVRTHQTQLAAASAAAIVAATVASVARLGGAERERRVQHRERAAELAEASLRLLAESRQLGAEARRRVGDVRRVVAQPLVDVTHREEALRPSVLGVPTAHVERVAPRLANVADELARRRRVGRRAAAVVGSCGATTPSLARP